MSKQPQDHFEELSALMTSQLRIRGRDFPAQVRRAGRLLPRRIRADAHYLIESATITQNPKLARMVDTRRTDAAYRNIKQYLEKIDPRARRTTQLLNLLASVALALIVTAALVVYVLVQRGYL